MRTLGVEEEGECSRGACEQWERELEKNIKGQKVVGMHAGKDKKRKMKIELSLP